VWNAEFNFMVRPQDDVLELTIVDATMQGSESWWNPLSWGFEEAQGDRYTPFKESVTLATLTVNLASLQQNALDTRWHDLSDHGGTRKHPHGGQVSSA
jgi:hypothetical protein